MTSPSTPLPSRPQLAEHVLARRHVIDGRETVVLHDQRRDEVLQVGHREWALIEAADGTRDLEGIVVAARRQGAHARVHAVEQLLGVLAQRGMVVSGEGAEPIESWPSATSRDGGTESRADEGEKTVAPPPSRPPSTVEIVDEPKVSPRPLIGLPEGLRCDGGGTCCRLYGTVMLSPEESVRVRALLPEWTVDSVPIERFTTPLRGSVPGLRMAALARNGACGLLQDDGLCAVHRVGGLEAKPLGCQLFPRVFIDDGEAVHVSLKPECPCVLDPQTDEAEPLVSEGWTERASLPPTIVVDTLPDSIELRSGQWAPRAQVRQWFSALAERPVPADLAATQWALAAMVDEHGLLDAGERLDACWRAEPPAAREVQPWIAAFQDRASARAREHAQWRSEQDLVRRISTAVATVTLLLCDPATLEEALSLPAELREHEARYWRTGLHGYRWAGRGALSTALRDEAVRIWVARSLPMVVPTDAPDFRAPLALVEALVRAHGVGSYVDDLR
ncbi:MAG: YkgJ family cysteine cluster protein [Myxococcota bacterium]